MRVILVVMVISSWQRRMLLLLMVEVVWRFLVFISSSCFFQSLYQQKNQTTLHIHPSILDRNPFFTFVLISLLTFLPLWHALVFGFSFLIVLPCCSSKLLFVEHTFKPSLSRFEVRIVVDSSYFWIFRVLKVF